MGQSINKTVISTLIETLQRKVEPAKLYDALRRIADDLAKTYDALFFGPLPAVSGKNLDLIEVPLEKYNPDLYTPFQEDQLIEGENKSWLVQWITPGVDSTGSFARMTQTADGTAIFSINLNEPETGWETDDGVRDGAALQMDNEGNVSFIQSILDVIYEDFKMGKDRILRLFLAADGSDEPALTDAVAGDIVIPNVSILRAIDSTGLKTYPLTQFDANDLLILGSNPTGATTGEGNISIPRAVTADMPTAGGTRNGILIINKTTHELCYYVNGLRYKLLGVAF